MVPKEPEKEKSIIELLGTDLTFQSIYVDSDGILKVRAADDKKTDDKQLLMMMSPYSGNVREFFKKMMPASIINVTNNNTPPPIVEKKVEKRPAGPVLDAVAKKQLLNDMKAEVRPLINQLCETMIQVNSKKIRADIKEVDGAI